MIKTTFTPGLNGFHFANRFVNNIVKLPIYGDITTLGRCGGMSYSALDCYLNGVTIPAFIEQDFSHTGGVPADGTPLSDFIFRRQIDSFLVPSAVKFVTWSVAPDGASLFLRGVTRWTKEDEFRKLRAAIDGGTPVPLGLIVARDLNGLAHNHQVVAYGYETSIVNDELTVLIYDNNHPDEEVKLTSKRDSPGFAQSTGEQWRGFFLQDYAPSQPPPNLGVLPSTAIAKSLAESASKRLSVVFETIMLYGDEDTYDKSDIALSLSAENQSLRWPRAGLKTLKIGKEYIINRTLEVEVDSDGVLSIVVSGADTMFGDLPIADNDEQVATLAKEHTADTRWGRGAHSEHVGNDAGGYTIRYTIKSRR